MKFKTSFIPLVSALTASCISIQSVHANQSDNASTLSNALADQLQYVLEAKQRYIIKFKNAAEDVSKANEASVNGKIPKETSPEFRALAAKEAVNRVAGRLHDIMEKRGLVVASLDSYALNEMKMRADVESISPDPIRTPLSQTVPYSYDRINATGIVQSDITAKKVCVIDSGIDAGHEDLPDQNNGLTGSETGSQVGNWYHDGYGHGTHVAGTIAAYDNSYGSVGVYPGVNMHVVKVFNDNGGWTYASSIIKAVDQCANAGAEVVNMSLGGPGSSNYEAQTLADYESQGLLLVAAAGNEGNSSKAYPASYDSVMSVAAVNKSGSRDYYSQYNDQVEIAAPGRGIYSTRKNNGYTTMSGTSMATPHVAGGAALVWSFFPQCTNQEVRTALTTTALDKGDPGRDNAYGHGLLQVNAAYDYLNTGCGGNSEEPDAEIVTVVKENLTQTAGSWLRYNLNLPENVGHLTVNLSGGSGEADLLVNYGRKVTRWHWDCHSNGSGNDEICSFEQPAAGKWSIGVRAHTDISGVKLSYSYSDTTADTGGDPGSHDGSEQPVTETKKNLSQLEGMYLRYSVDVPEGASQLTVELSDGNGNANLMVNAGRKATRWHWDCYSREKDNNEICKIDNPVADSWSIAVRAETDFSGVTLKYSYE